MIDRATRPADLLNFRDLGGLKVGGGKRTRRGLVFRSDSLARVTAPDADVLTGALGIGSVIDLRSALEVAGSKLWWVERPGVAYLNTPFSDGFEELGEDLSTAELEAVVWQKYDSYLERSSANILRALGAIAESAENGVPTIFACTYGKDRTGVLAAVLLDLLGVGRAEIAADYLATQPVMGALLDRMKSDPLHGPRIGSTPAEVYQATRHTIDTFLINLEAKGGASAWTRSQGMSDEVVGILRRSLVEPA